MIGPLGERKGTFTLKRWKVVPGVSEGAESECGVNPIRKFASKKHYLLAGESSVLEVS
jgi:hypothetical protein